MIWVEHPCGIVIPEIIGGTNVTVGCWKWWRVYLQRVCHTRPLWFDIGTCGPGRALWHQSYSRSRPRFTWEYMYWQIDNLMELLLANIHSEERRHIRECTSFALHFWGVWQLSASLFPTFKYLSSHMNDSPRNSLLFPRHTEVDFLLFSCSPTC